MQYVQLAHFRSGTSIRVLKSEPKFFKRSFFGAERGNSGSLRRESVRLIFSCLRNRVIGVSCDHRTERVHENLEFEIPRDTGSSPTTKDLHEAWVRGLTPIGGTLGAMHTSSH